MAKQDTSKKVHQREKLKLELSIRERQDLTEKQKQCINLILDNKTKAVIIKGVAGTSKSFLAILAGLRLMNEKKISDIIYVRSMVESAKKGAGYLPGTRDEKLEPYLMPLMDKLEELLPKTQIQSLINDSRVHGIPINYLRGSNFAAKYLILDEFQNCTFGEIVTTITRVAEKSKLIMLADPRQADIRDSGFNDIYNLFDDQESRDNGIFTFEFTKEDIVRSEFVKFIMTKLESLDKKDGDWAPGK
jgi:predicted ribonuclease YlaK